ncbi:MAG: hypothetical protein LAT68_08945 [Cyclobacteriaceae bacterium]|nr:hypothetical protein [Cyclobacteriaceae bacterium]MCH8516442.1 hypothetical protein [Cyclobacteriaceae bacterium]
MNHKDTKEVFMTQNAGLNLCEKREQFILNFQNTSLELKICELIKLRNKINEVDIIHMLSVDTPDIEVFYLPMSQRFLILNLREILELKELLSGSFVMLDLNTTIQKITSRQL